MIGILIMAPFFKYITVRLRTRIHNHHFPSILALLFIIPRDKYNLQFTVHKSQLRDYCCHS